MKRVEIEAQLTELFRDLFADDALVLTDATTAADIDGWDSFNHISIIVAVETRFGIMMQTREIESLKDVGAMVRLIESKRKGDR